MVEGFSFLTFVCWHNESPPTKFPKFKTWKFPKLKVENMDNVLPIPLGHWTNYLFYETKFGVYSIFHVCYLIIMVILLIYCHQTPGVSREWDWLIIWGGIMCFLAPWCTNAFQFFKSITDTDSSRQSFWYIVLGLHSWVFAKSIYNASTLGAKFGIVGGLAYACWYGAFFTVGLTIYRIRKMGFKSLPEAINARYGPLACITYCLAILYRLEQEVWSNAIVVASFYGPPKSQHWWTAAAVSAAIPAIYVFMGGLKSSILTDGFQGIVAIFFFVGMMIAIGVKSAELPCPEDRHGKCDLFEWNVVPGRNPWSLEGGQDLVIVGLLQGFLSYGFFDPVMTDRAFLLEPKTMFKAYCLGGFLDALYIVGFSLVGIFGVKAYFTDPDAHFKGIKSGYPADITKYLGSAFYSVINVIFITSSIGTVDSTFSSTSKVIGPELMDFIFKGKPTRLSDTNMTHVWLGRLAIVVMCIVGILPLLKDNLLALSATTETGTILMGLGPPILFLPDLEGYRPLCFHIPFWICVCLGVVLTLTNVNNDIKTYNQVDIHGLAIGQGSYGVLLGLNVLGVCLAWGTFWLFALENRTGQDIDRTPILSGPKFISGWKNFSSSIASIVYDPLPSQEEEEENNNNNNNNNHASDETTSPKIDPEAALESSESGSPTGSGSGLGDDSSVSIYLEISQSEANLSSSSTSPSVSAPPSSLSTSNPSVPFLDSLCAIS